MYRSRNTYIDIHTTGISGSFSLFYRVLFSFYPSKVAFLPPFIKLIRFLTTPHLF